MGSQVRFPSLEGWEPTRDTLHGYVQAISSVPRALAEPHPKWWHISLQVQEFGASTGRIPHPSDPQIEFQLHLDLQTHAARIETSSGDRRSVSLLDGLTTAAFGERLLEELGRLGVATQVDRHRFADDSARQYAPGHAEAYRQALVSVNQVLVEHQARLSGETGPVQLWPHNFDLAFEWFGTLRVPGEGEDESPGSQAQINFGFAPGDASHPDPYFYSNPWPFSAELTERPLPEGARWMTGSWKGSLLPYDAVVGGSADKLLAYYQAVYELASPQLTA